MKVQSYSDVIIGNYPHVEDFGRELKPILENEVSTVGQTNVKATIHTHWNYLPDHPEVIRFKKFIIKEVDKHFNPSVIGGEKEGWVARFKHKMPTGRINVSSGEATLCGVFVCINDTDGMAVHIEPIIKGPHLINRYPEKI